MQSEPAHAGVISAREPRSSALRYALLRIATAVVTVAYRLYRVHPAVWRWTARHYQPWMENFARLNAWMVCQQAYLDVPAYRAYQQANGFRFRWRLDDYRPTSKTEYVNAYPEAQRCWHGRIDTIGTVVDESSGSSGTPYNWLRSRRELNTVHKNVAGYVTQIFGARKLFAINAFSMGAWATGTNTGIAMSKIAMVKNTGPDIEKIVDTLLFFGPGYVYVISAYPPFLKHLRDRLDAEPGFDWERYTLNGFVGGEALTEGLRDYLEDRFNRVYSGYGASDLTIGMAGESDLTVWLRRALANTPALREDVLGAAENRIPMIFQYNPLETFLETTDQGELLVTLNSTDIMSPKTRYNIGDEAMIVDFPSMEALVGRHPRLAFGYERAFTIQRMRLPFVLLFGRKDSTISYMGANIYPIDVENGLYLDNPYASAIESFKLGLLEIGGFEQRPIIHLQLREGSALDEADRADLRRRAAEGVLSHLARVSRDIAQSLAEDPTTRDVRIEVHEHGTGPFVGGNIKIKNAYTFDQKEDLDQTDAKRA